VIPKVSSNLFEDICAYCYDPFLEQPVVAHKDDGKYQCLIHEDCQKTWQKVSNYCMKCHVNFEQFMTSWERFETRGWAYAGASFISLEMLLLYVYFNMNQLTLAEKGAPSFQRFRDHYYDFAKDHQQLSDHFGESIEFCSIPSIELYKDYVEKLYKKNIDDERAFFLNMKITMIGAHVLGGFGSAMIFDMANMRNFRKRMGDLFIAVILLYYSYYLCKESAPYINDDYIPALGMAFVLNICSVLLRIFFEKELFWSELLPLEYLSAKN